MGQREKAGKRHFIQDAKDSRQMLDTLLSEVSCFGIRLSQLIVKVYSYCVMMPVVVVDSAAVVDPNSFLRFDICRSQLNTLTGGSQLQHKRPGRGLWGGF